MAENKQWECVGSQIYWHGRTPTPLNVPCLSEAQLVTDRSAELATVNSLDSSSPLVKVLSLDSSVVKWFTLRFTAISKVQTDRPLPFAQNLASTETGGMHNPRHGHIQPPSDIQE